MLAVDREQSGATRRGRLGHQSAGGDQCLLVGERDRFPCLNCGHRRAQPGAADDRCDNQIRIIGRSFDKRLFSGGGTAVRALQKPNQLIVTPLVGDEGKPWVVAAIP